MLGLSTENVPALDRGTTRSVDAREESEDASAFRPAQPSQDQRWAAIYYDVQSMASAAYHSRQHHGRLHVAPVNVDPILAATAGLLARYAQS